jgi:hypothetical protein
MTVYTGRTFQTCALRVWGIWVSMRDFHAATVRSDEARDRRLISQRSRSAKRRTRRER